MAKIESIERELEHLQSLKKITTYGQRISDITERTAEELKELLRGKP